MLTLTFRPFCWYSLSRGMSFSASIMVETIRFTGDELLSPTWSLVSSSVYNPNVISLISC